VTGRFADHIATIPNEQAVSIPLNHHIKYRYAYTASSGLSFEQVLLPPRGAVAFRGRSRVEREAGSQEHRVLAVTALQAV